jgi:hypothetical protein
MYVETIAQISYLVLIESLKCGNLYVLVPVRLRVVLAVQTADVKVEIAVVIEQQATRSRQKFITFGSTSTTTGRPVVPSNF